MSFASMRSPCLGRLCAVSQDPVRSPHSVLLVMGRLLILGTGPNDPRHVTNTCSYWDAGSDQGQTRRCGKSLHMQIEAQLQDLRRGL